jgi:SAM-dependent methyltransferase
MPERTVNERWVEGAKTGGYDFHVSASGGCAKARTPSRLFKKILARTDLPLRGNGRSAFEFGCGGAQHLVPFAANGWRCIGIDLSPEFLARAEAYRAEVSAACGRELPLELVQGDFFEYAAPRAFDLVFHVGVIEHLLDERERLSALGKMRDMTLSGGFIVSVVPSGMHPLRERSREEGIGGYNIPEIDYTPERMLAEFQELGLRDVRVYPHNVFGYLVIDTGNVLVRAVRRMLFTAFQLVPVGWLPRAFAFRHAYSLIGIAQKP